MRERGVSVNVLVNATIVPCCNLYWQKKSKNAMEIQLPTPGLMCWLVVYGWEPLHCTTKMASTELPTKQGPRVHLQHHHVVASSWLLRLQVTLTCRQLPNQMWLIAHLIELLTCREESLRFEFRETLNPFWLFNSLTNFLTNSSSVARKLY